MDKRQIQDLLIKLQSQPVESLDHFNVSIGGYNVNGVNGPAQMHPLVLAGQAAIAPILRRVQEKTYPLHEILILNAITKRPSTQLEGYVTRFEEPPPDVVADERRQVLAERGLRDRHGAERPRQNL